MVDYWTSVPVRGGEVNATNGNFLFHETDFNLEAAARASMSTVLLTVKMTQQAFLVKAGQVRLKRNLLKKKTEISYGWNRTRKSIVSLKGDKYEAPPGIYSEITKNADGYLKIEEDKSETRF